MKCLRHIFPAWPLNNNDLKAEALIYGFLDIFECKLENTIGCSHLISIIVHVEIHNVLKRPNQRSWIKYLHKYTTDRFKILINGALCVLK